MNPKLISLIVLAVLLATTFLPVVSAEAVEFEEINVQIESQHAEDYDAINNLADPTMHNRDTWIPEPEGIFIGGVTPESLFYYTNHTGTDANHAYRISQDVKFDSGQIMDGVSNFIVRSPWAHTSAPNVQNPNLIITDEDGKIFSARHNYYVENERAYFIVDFFLYPGVLYNFEFYISTGFAGGAPYFWVSPNDVASDGITNMTIWRTGNTPVEIPADSGISFDMRRGAGGGIAGVDISMAANEWLWFTRPAADFTGSAFQTLIIPLVSTDPAPLDVYVYSHTLDMWGSPTLTLLWQRTGQNFEGNIIASSGSTFNNADHIGYSIFIKARSACDITLIATGDRDGWEAWENRAKHALATYSPASGHVLGPPASQTITQYGFPFLATLTPSASAYQGPGYIEDWLELDRRIMQAFTTSEWLGIMILNAVFAPIAPWYQIYTGDNLGQTLYFAIADNVIPAVGAYIQNGVDRARELAAQFGEWIMGIGEDIVTWIKMAISVLLKAFELAFSFIAFLLIQMIFFWLPFQIVRLGEMLVSSAKGDHARAGRIAEKQRAGGRR